MLLTQAFDASISIVYLTQELVGESQPQLIPIATYPETLMERDRQTNAWRLPFETNDSELALNSIVEGERQNSKEGLAKSNTPSAAYPAPDTTPLPENLLTPGAASLTEQRQMVLPLVFEDNVLGLLVTRRDDRGWEMWEQTQVEEIAKTLAIACVMDQRHLWGQQEREQEHLQHLQQRDLMDNLLHQFRNSLTALQTFGKLILKRLTPGDRTQELANSVMRETDRLCDLAQQMEVALETGLPLTQALPASMKPPFVDEEQLGDATLEPRSLALPAAIALLPGGQLPLERCLLETVLEPMLASARAIAQEKGLSLDTNVPEDLPPIWTNAKALREALNNLIENAIKYTPAPGTISVVATALDTSDYLEVSISDTGMGIPAQDLPHLFERHFRGVQAAGAIPGSGLGLAITRSLIQQIQGKIQVFSPALPANHQTPGIAPLPTTSGGTTFLVELPIARAVEDEF